MTITNPLWGELDSLLRQRRDEGLERIRHCWVPVSPRLIASQDGCQYLHFGSNDYLCMGWQAQSDSSTSSFLGSTKDHDAKRPEGDRSSRFGAGASPSVTGYTPDHVALVNEICRFTRAEDAILFPSGYSANVGTVAALAGPSDVVFSDRLNHASLIDGCRLSKAKIVVYPHCDMDELERLIRTNRHQGKRGFLVTDSVFSMDGDLADLAGILKLCEQFDLTAIADEAHATGVYGQRGGGLTEHFGINSDRIIKIGTLSKAVGALGGFVAGPKTLVQWLVNFARPHIYSTALPVPVVQFAAKSLAQIVDMDQQRRRLRHTAANLRTMLLAEGHRVSQGDSPIVSIYAPSVDTVMEWGNQLRDRGFFVPAIRPPTVPSDGSLLRVSLNLAHTDEDLRLLVSACRF